MTINLSLSLPKTLSGFKQWFQTRRFKDLKYKALSAKEPYVRELSAKETYIW